MKIVQVYNNTCDSELRSGLEHKEATFIYGIVDKNYLLVNGNSYNEEKRQELGINILPLPLNLGGSLVISQGDIEVGILVPQEIGNETLTHFADALVNFFENEGIDNVTFDGNDVLIDNYKVSGMAQMVQNNYSYVACHIAVNVDLELIKALCTKKMEKVPKGLSEYGLMTEKIVAFLIEWAEQVKL